MAKILQHRRGTATEHANFVGAEGEFTYDTSEKRVRVHDGSTKAGTPMAKVSEVNQVQTNLNNAKTELQNKVNEVAANAGDAFQEDILEAANTASASVFNVGGLDAAKVLGEVEVAKTTALTMGNDIDAKFSPLRNFFRGNVELTPLMGSQNQSSWQGSGTITFAQPWRNFDALAFFFTNDGSNSWMTLQIVYPWMVQWLIDMGTMSNKQYVFPFPGFAGHYWGWHINAFGDTQWTTSAENSGIQAIYGIKFKGD